MAQKTAAGRTGRKVVSATDPELPVGRNLYFDKKKRVIYTSPLLHEALYIPKYDYKKFNRYKSRFIIFAAVFMIAGTTLESWFNISFWYGALLALAVFLGIEISFYKFQKSLIVVKDFDKAKAEKTSEEVIDADARMKCWIKILLYLALGILLVYNAYDSGYSQYIIWLCWAALVLCLYMAFSLLLVLIRSPKA